MILKMSRLETFLNGLRLSIQAVAIRTTTITLLGRAPGRNLRISTRRNPTKWKRSWKRSQKNLEGYYCYLITWPYWLQQDESKLLIVQNRRGKKCEKSVQIMRPTRRKRKGESTTSGFCNTIKLVASTTTTTRKPTNHRGNVPLIMMATTVQEDQMQKKK